MAHEIENIMYLGDVPWHGLGRRVIEAPSVEEAIIAAGLDWEVGLKKLQTTDTLEEVPALATFRKTDNRILGVVGSNYSVLQNKDAFQFFNPFLESKEATLETAGSLRNGQRIWILAKINRPDSVIVKQADDRVQKYILLSNSHDGSLAVRVGYTPIRVVCNNTLSMAMTNNNSQLIRLKHTGNIVENLNDIREVMNAADAAFEATAEQFRLLASKQFNSKDLEKYIKVVFATKKQMQEAASAEDLTSGSRVMGDIVQLFESGKGNDLPGVKGTAWAAYNAVTEYLQYKRGNNTENRLNELWFGQGATLSKKALEKATEMVLFAA